MPSGAEIEALVVRLESDVAQYVQGMQRAQQATEQTVRAAQSKLAAYQSTAGQVGKVTEAMANNVTRSQSKIVSGFGGMQTAMFTLGAVVGGVLGLGIQSIVNLLKEAVANFLEAERVVAGLEAVLISNKREVDKLLPTYQAFADQLKELTGISDDAILGFLQIAESFGKTGESAMEAVRSALALSKVTGASVEGLLRFTQALEEGDTEAAMMFSRMIPQLRGIKDEAELMARVQELVSAGWAVMERQSNTLGAQIQRLTLGWEDALEVLGGSLVPILQPLSSLLRSVVEAVAGLFKALQPLVEIMTPYYNLLTAIVRELASFISVLAEGISHLVAWGREIIGINRAHEEFQRIQREIAAQNKKANEQWDEGTKKLLDRIRTIDDVKQREQELQKQVELYTKLVDENKKSVQDAQRALEQDVPLLDKVRQKVGMIAPTYEELKSRLDLNEQALSQNQRRLEALRKELENLRNVPPNVSRAIAEFNKELERSIKTMGKTADEIKLLEFEEKVGHRESPELERARALVEEKKRVEELTKKKQELDNAVSSLTQSLEDEIGQLRLGADAYKLQQLRTQGLADEEIERIQGLIQLRDQLRENKKVEEEARRVMEEFADPAQKMQKRIDELTVMLDRGLITQEVYDKAVAKLEKEFSDTSDTVQELTKDIQGFDATLSGSLEAMSRVRNQTERLRQQFEALREGNKQGRVGMEIRAAVRAQERQGIQRAQAATEVGRAMQAPIPGVPEAIATTIKIDQPLDVQVLNWDGLMRLFPEQGITGFDQPPVVPEIRLDVGQLIDETKRQGDLLSKSVNLLAQIRALNQAILSKPVLEVSVIEI